MLADRESRALFAANHNLVLFNQLPNVLEADWSFVQRNLVLFGERINQVGRRHRLSHAISPPAALHQIIEKQSNNIIRLHEGAVLIDNSKAVSIAIRRDSDARSDLAHLRAQ